MAGVVTKIVEVVTRLRDQVTKPTERLIYNMNRMGKQQKTLSEYSKKLGVDMVTLKRGLAMQGITWKKGVGWVGMFGRKIKNLDLAMKKAAIITRRFKFEWLGILFFGMAIKRFFGGILRAGVSTFTKLHESSGFFGTAIQQLSVHWEYLKYIVGSAINSVLEPLMPKIMDIISRVSDWIQQHKKLVGSVIIVGLILGGLMVLLGTLKLGFSSLRMAINGAINGFGLFKVALGFLLSPIGLIIAGFVLLILLIPKARKAFMELFRNLGRALTAIGKAIMAVFKGDWELATMYAKLALFHLLDAASSFAKTILQVFVSVATNMIKIWAAPIEALLWAIDKVSGTDYLGKFLGMIDRAKEKISSGIEGFFPEKSAMTIQLEKEIEDLLKKREEAKRAGAKAETPAGQVTNIGTLNVELKADNYESSVDIMNKIVNEAKRYT